jgi:hypothetical protein
MSRPSATVTTDKNSEMVQNTPAWMRNWKENMDRPPASWELRSMRPDERLASPVLNVCFP